MVRPPQAPPPWVLGWHVHPSGQSDSAVQEHAPFRHSPLWQVRPQRPQLAGSVAKLAQVAPHGVSPLAQGVQAPFWQTPPSGQPPQHAALGMHFRRQRLVPAPQTSFRRRFLLFFLAPVAPASRLPSPSPPSRLMLPRREGATEDSDGSSAS